jgi:hypothetical protein
LKSSAGFGANTTRFPNGQNTLNAAAGAPRLVPERELVPTRPIIAGALLWPHSGLEPTHFRDRDPWDDIEDTLAFLF